MNAIARPVAVYDVAEEIELLRYNAERAYRSARAYRIGAEGMSLDEVTCLFQDLEDRLFELYGDLDVAKERHEKGDVQGAPRGAVGDVSDDLEIMLGNALVGHRSAKAYRISSRSMTADDAKCLFRDLEERLYLLHDTLDAALERHGNGGLVEVSA